LRLKSFAFTRESKAFNRKGRKEPLQSSRRKTNTRCLIFRKRLAVRGQRPKTNDQILPLNRLNQFCQQRSPPGQVGKRDELMRGVCSFPCASKTIQRGDPQACREVPV